MSPAGLVATESNMQRIRAERTAAVDNPTWATIKGLFDHLIADEKNRIPDIIAVRQAIYRLPETRDAIDHVLILQEPGGTRPQSHHREGMDDDRRPDPGGRLGTRTTASTKAQRGGSCRSSPTAGCWKCRTSATGPTLRTRTSSTRPPLDSFSNRDLVNRRTGERREEADR